MSGETILGLSVRWARRLLVASLAVNFLIIGTAVGLGLRHDPHDRGGYGRFYAEIAETVADEDRRAEVKKILKSGRDGWRASRDQRNTAWISVADILARDPYDEAALSAIFAEEVETRGAQRLESRASLVKAFAIMTPEERAAVAERIREFVEMRRSHDRRRG